jgi:hypothetical protein
LRGDNPGKLVDGGSYFFIREVAIHHPDRFIAAHFSSLWSHGPGANRPRARKTKFKIYQKQISLSMGGVGRVVSVLKIKGHSQAPKCHAWSSPIEGSTKRRYLAMLHIPPIDSPEKAVRAAIVHDFKIGKTKT